MKRLFILILCCTLLVGCGSTKDSTDVSLSDDMSVEEAIKYAEVLFQDNVEDSDSKEELLSNMIEDAINDSVDVTNKAEDFVVEYEGGKYWIGMTIQDIVDQGFYALASGDYMISDLTYLEEPDEVDLDDYKDDGSNMEEILSSCKVEDMYSTIYVSVYTLEDGELDNVDKRFMEDELDLTACSFSEDPLVLKDCKIDCIEANTQYFAEALGLTYLENKLVSLDELKEKLGEPIAVNDGMLIYEERQTNYYFQLAEDVYLYTGTRYSEPRDNVYLERIWYSETSPASW